MTSMISMSSTSAIGMVSSGVRRGLLGRRAGAARRVVAARLVETGALRVLVAAARFVVLAALRRVVVARAEVVARGAVPLAI